jgi:hypothetical protein
MGVRVVVLVYVAPLADLYTRLRVDEARLRRQVGEGGDGRVVAALPVFTHG